MPKYAVRPVKSQKVAPSEIILYYETILASQKHPIIERTMSLKTLSVVLIPAILWIVKSFVYWLFLRLRHIPATALSCLIIAGAPTLSGLLPIPFPVSLLAGAGLASYLIVTYTEADYYPTALFLALGVELVFFFIVGLSVGQIAWG